MNANIKFDLREFNSMMKKCVEISHRTGAQVINSRGYHVVQKAQEETPMASRGRIQQEMGATLVAQKRDKKGKIKRRYSYKPTRLVYLIINKRQKKLGKAPLFGSEMDAQAKKVISYRLRAVGTLKAGWRGALRIFARAARMMGGDSAGPGAKRQGKASPAKAGQRPEATFEYNQIVERGAAPGAKQIHPNVEKALTKAFAREAMEMKKHLDEKLTDEFKRIGAS